MKKSILAMVMAGGCLTVFAQTNPVRTTTTSQSTTNNSVTNSTTDPMNSVTNTQVNSATNNSVNTSTSWAPVGSPNWGWNNYGLWNTRTDMNSTSPNSTYRTNNSMLNSTSNPSYNTSVPTGTTNMGTITTGTSNTYNNSANATPPVGSVDAMNTTGTTPMNTTSTTPMNTTSTTPMNTAATGMNSTGAYDAYGASTPNYSTPIAAAPMNVYMNFSKEYPTSVGQTYTWNQYGDWYETQYIDKGRLTQYYYDQKGTGYSLSLPVLQTYVPEEIVDKALQKYGSGLYSIGVIKAADGMPTYSIGLLNRGELQMVHLKEDGSSAASVWRTEEPMADGMMNTTDSNAAMGTQSNMTTEPTMTDDATMRMKEDKAKDMKWKESGKKEKKDKMKHKKEKMENKEDKMPK